MLAGKSQSAHTRYSYISTRRAHQFNAISALAFEPRGSRARRVASRRGALKGRAREPRGRVGTARRVRGCESARATIGRAPAACSRATRLTRLVAFPPGCPPAKSCALAFCRPLCLTLPARTVHGFTVNRCSELSSPDHRPI